MLVLKTKSNIPLQKRMTFTRITIGRKYRCIKLKNKQLKVLFYDLKVKNNTIENLSFIFSHKIIPILFVLDLPGLFV